MRFIMPNTTHHPIFIALQERLHHPDTKLSKESQSIIAKYIQEKIDSSFNTVWLQAMQESMDAQDGDREETILMLAVRYASKKEIKLLIALGANLELKNKEGCTALMLAVKAMNWDMVTTLINLGAD